MCVKHIAAHIVAARAASTRDGTGAHRVRLRFGVIRKLVGGLRTNHYGRPRTAAAIAAATATGDNVRRHVIVVGLCVFRQGSGNIRDIPVGGHTVAAMPEVASATSGPGGTT